MSSQDLERVKQRRLTIRQIVIFATMGGLLTAGALIGLATLTGRMEPLIDQPFASNTPVVVDFGPTPCPVGANAVYPLLSSTKINALNGSNIRGAARVAGETLESRGFGLGRIADASVSFPGSVLIMTGAKGVNAAYLVLANAPDDAILAFDSRQDATVDLIVGEKWDGLRDAEAVTAKAGETIPVAAGCSPVADLIDGIASGTEVSPTGTTSQQSQG
ncbi:MAG: LytR C-terminal domain-containing protein [Bifidobacteriaceae bacterium]|jgi:hypothetical protein|nr:LytR C-terminal domain-containing protein [Bifidobacteriaceae bacterium]